MDFVFEKPGMRRDEQLDVMNTRVFRLQFVCLWCEGVVQLAYVFCPWCGKDMRKGFNA